MESGKIRISPNHRRVLSVRMRLLEDYCLQLLDLLHPVEAAYTRRSALPAEKAEELRAAVNALRSRIVQVKSELELEQFHQSAKREALALVATLMTNVEELHPRYLKGYGTVPDPLAGYLQGCLADLAKELKTVNRILGDR